MVIAIAVFAFGFIIVAGALDARKENNVSTRVTFILMGCALLFVATILFFAAIP